MANGPEAFDRNKADQQDVLKSSEPWSEYELKDGTKLRMKSVLLEVWKDRVQKDPQGNPMYHIMTSAIVSATHPSPKRPSAPKKPRT